MHSNDRINNAVVIGREVLSIDALLDIGNPTLILPVVTLQQTTPAYNAS